MLQSRPKNGNVGIVPFELLWTKKTDLNDIYGGSQETQAFFIEELVDDMKEVDETEDTDVEFEIKEKRRLEDVKSELPNVIHKPYGYYEYSELDESNNRFMRKQENTNMLKDNIFTQVNEESNKKDKKNLQNDLFESIDEEVPF